MRKILIIIFILAFCALAYAGHCISSGTSSKSSATRTKTSQTPDQTPWTEEQILADGSIAFTADVNFGGYNLTNTGYMEGSVLFIDPNSDITEDNTNLYWDDVNDILTATTLTDGTFSVTGGAITGATNTNWDAAYTHISESGASHTYINQNVTTAGTPSFAGLASTGNVVISNNGVLQVQTGTTPTSPTGVGVDVRYDSDAVGPEAGTGLGTIQAYDWTGTAFKDFEIRGRTLYFRIGATDKFHITTGGDAFFAADVTTGADAYITNSLGIGTTTLTERLNLTDTTGDAATKMQTGVTGNTLPYRPGSASEGTITDNGYPWNNPSNITDGGNADCLVESNISDDLRAYNFGFDSGVLQEVPADATIVGIIVTIRRRASDSEAVRDCSIKLVDGDGSVVGDNKADTGTNWPTLQTEAQYGGVADMWGTSLTAADIRDSDFGVDIEIETDTEDQDETGYVDWIKIQVYYTRLTYYTAGIDETDLSYKIAYNSALGGTDRIVIDPTGNTKIGDGTNQLVISSTGVVTMEGTAKRDLTLRPDLDFSTITAQGKPTRITYGAYQGYSLPLYAADEELFFNINVPGRWDGASDITLDILVCLSQNEDLNDDFNLQLSWANSETGEPILNTTTDVPVETNLVAGRITAYDTYLVNFTIDYDADVGNHIISHDDLALRLRRLAVAGTEITGEVIVLDYHLHFTVDKALKAPE